MRSSRDRDCAGAKSSSPLGEEPSATSLILGGTSTHRRADGPRSSTVTSSPLWRTTCSEREKRRQSPSSDQSTTASSPPIPVLGVGQGSTGGLALPEAFEVAVQGLCLGIGSVDHLVAGGGSGARPAGESWTSLLKGRARVFSERMAPSGTATPW